jgi:hypothetical protein
VYFDAGAGETRGFLEWWRTVAGGRPGAGRVAMLPLHVGGNADRLRALLNELEEGSRKGARSGKDASVVAVVDGKAIIRGAREVRAGLTGFLNLEVDGRPITEADRRALREEGAAAKVLDAPPRNASPDPGEGPDRAPATDGPLEVWLFYFSYCRGCKEALAAMRQTAAGYGEKVSLKEYDTVLNPEAVPLVFAVAEQYRATPAVLPSMLAFAGDSVLLGADAIVADTSATIERQLRLGGVHLRVKRPPDGDFAPDALASLSLAPLALAALADGVNPCAFATVVLLVSMMAAAGRTRGQTLVMGAAFTGAVYVTYFLIGLVLFSVLQRVSGVLIVSDLVFYAAFGACAAFGLLSLYDAALAWRGRQPGDMLLKVPESLRNRMRKSMRAGVHARSLLLGAAGAGVVVSLLESACTGQVYFPLIAGLVHDPATRARGIALLAWSNLLFVTPLLAVFGLAVLGVGSDRLAAFGRKHWGLTKLLLALVFIAMAWWMAPGLVWPPGVR